MTGADIKFGQYPQPYTTPWTPASGDTITGSSVAGGELIEIQAAGDLASLTLNLEANDSLPTGSSKQIACNHRVTNFTLNASAQGGTIRGSTMTVLVPNGTAVFKKISSLTWRRLN